MRQESDLLFRVIVPGHEYRIYAGGRVEGFGNDVKIINYFYRVCSDLLRANRSLEQVQTMPLDSAVGTESHEGFAEVQAQDALQQE